MAGARAPKTVVVTGASRGIGRATAIGAGARGWRVAVNYRSNSDAAEDAVRAVEAAGGRAVAIQGDMRREAEVVDLFDRSEQAFGPIDALVANAGAVSPSMRLVDMSVDRIENVLAANLTSALLCAREAARRFSQTRRKRPASITFVSSAAARLGSPFEYVDYAAAKGAVDTLTIGLSKELAEAGIRVNAVRPGLIDTDIHASGGDPNRAARLGAATPMARPGGADEVAEAILWLISDAASYTTGALLDVAGGR